MSVKFFWQLPAGGDGRFGNAETRLRGERRAAEPRKIQQGVSDPRGTAFNYFDYLHQIARAAELSTFDGLRIQHDPRGDESWIIAGYVARGTRKLTLLTEFEASWGSSVYAAKNAVSVQRYTGGRFAWQLSHGPGERERRRSADPVAEVDILSRIEEFVTVARGVIGTAPYSFKGRFFEVRDGGFRGTLANHPAPPVYLSGETEHAYETSARVADVHIFEPIAPHDLPSRIARLRELQQRQTTPRQAGPLEFGVRVDVLARETTEEARRDAERYAKQANVSTSFDSEARLWKELATSTTGGSTTLVGSYAEVAAQLASYAELGVSHLLLGAVPHLEEAYRVGAHVLPLVRSHLSSRAAA
jgi:alkanesulfonate monooxygenase